MNTLQPKNHHITSPLISNKRRARREERILALAGFYRLSGLSIIPMVLRSYLHSFVLWIFCNTILARSPVNTKAEPMNKRLCFCIL
mgnify:CR=1 FL=1